MLIERGRNSLETIDPKLHVLDRSQTVQDLVLQPFPNLSLF